VKALAADGRKTFDKLEGHFMKILKTLNKGAYIVLIFVSSVSSAQRWAGTSRPYIPDDSHFGNYYQPSPAPPRDWRISFVPKDPWRMINGQTNYVKLDGVEFSGQVVDILPNGIRINGRWGKLGVASQEEDFFVANYPYQVVSDTMISSYEHLMAWYVGTYTYATVNGGSRTIHKLDYGIPCGPYPEKTAALQKQIQEEKQFQRETELKKIESLKEAATNGDGAAQYSLGIHYLHGIAGCETNKDAAIFWLSKSAAQGNITASNDLDEVKLNTNNMVSQSSSVR
jgi:hypothetical protein